METRSVAAGGRRVHVRVAGGAAGPPLVLVHGLIVSSRSMLPLVRELEGELPIYAPDLPGYGLSEKPPRALDTAELAAALGEAIDALALERPVLLGVSYGCQIVAELVAARPDAARACILVSPTYDPAASSLRNTLRWLANAPLERPSIVPVVARDLADMGLARAFRTTVYSMRHRIELRLPHVPHPTLVVTGELDPTVPRRWGDEAARLLPCARHVVVPRGPHTLNYSRPREVAALVRAFIGDL